MPQLMTQFDWLMRQLEPKECLELIAARDYLMSHHLDTQGSCPLFRFEEKVAANITIADMLSGGFMWDQTPQGFAYWKALCDKYTALEAIKQRKGNDS